MALQLNMYNMGCSDVFSKRLMADALWEDNIEQSQTRYNAALNKRIHLSAALCDDAQAMNGCLNIIDDVI